MSAHRHFRSSSQGTAHPPIFGVELDCHKALAERKRIAALPWWRRWTGRV